MTVEETIDKLIQLKLPHMAAALRAQLERPGNALGVEECVGLMVDREWTERDNRRLGRRIKDAKLGMQACLEDVRCDPARGLDKAVVRSLGTVRLGARQAERDRHRDDGHRARATSAPPSPRPPAGTATVPCAPGCRGSSGTSPSPAPTAPTPPC